MDEEPRGGRSEPGMGVGAGTGAGVRIGAGVWWPLWAGLVVLAGVGVWIPWVVIARTGQFVYALDDPYLQMAIGKNLAEHGVWGVTRYEFSSASSSLLWPLIEAVIFLVVGKTAWVAYGVSMAAGAGLVAVAWWMLRGAGVVGWRSFVVLAGIVLLAPLGPVSLAGLEHVGHAVATLGMAGVAAIVLERGKERRSAGLDIAVCVLTLVVVMVRYEGLFLAASLTLLLLWQRRLGLACAVVASAWVPPVVYGMYSISMGSMFFPNSVMLKGQVGDLHSLSGLYHGFVEKWFRNRLLFRSAHVFALVGLAGVLLVARGREGWRKPGAAGYLAMLFIPAALLHLEFSTVGSFFRYEMYLVPLGLVMAGVFLFGREGWGARGGAWKAAVGVVAVGTVAALVWRGVVAHARVTGAAADLYGFHWKSTEFIKRYYDGRTLVINDIGMPGFYTDIRMVDVWGLANVETARLSYQGKLDAGAIGRMAGEHGACIAVVYPGRLGVSGPPAGWRKAAEWRVDRMTVLAEPVFEFYAVEGAEFAGLVEHMKEFEGTLPAWVHHTTFGD